MPTATKPTGSQFDGLLAKRKQPTSATNSPADGKVDTAQKGRSTLAKSKDPEFRPSTLYLRKKTLTECEYRLKSNEDSRDMSELVEDLMSAWLADSAS
jgi:hypothetical protein